MSQPKFEPTEENQHLLVGKLYEVTRHQAVYGSAIMGKRSMLPIARLRRDDLVVLLDFDEYKYRHWAKILTPKGIVGWMYLDRDLGDLKLYEPA